MKWFQHRSDTYNNLKVRQLIRTYGMAGYGVFWVCCELVAQQGIDYKVTKDKKWKMFLEDIVGIGDVESDVKDDVGQNLTFVKSLDDILLLMADCGLIDKEEYLKGVLFIPKMGDYSDDYTKRNRRLSEQPLENIPLDKIRTDKKRVDNIKTYSLSFENFWKHYPSKTGKGYAFTCWVKINPSEKLQRTILAKVKEQQKSQKWLEGYIPNPSTYLNQSRWEDEVEVKQNEEEKLWTPTK